MSSTSTSPSCRTPPLARTHEGEPFWCESVPQARALYCNVRLMRALSKPAQEMLARLDAEAPDRLILDLRQNPGGDYNEGERHLVRPLRERPRINARGHLFVLAGASTFSAAMNNAAQFRTSTAAALRGETIGERPNGYQEVDTMTLPRTHLVVHYSTRYYAFVKGGDNVIAPDETIAPTWAEYVAGEDPVLERAMRWK